TYSIERLYRTTDIEVLYFNNRMNPAENCVRSGPALGTGRFDGEYHRVSGSTVSWAIPVIDRGGGVWRVLVVYTLNTTDSNGRGQWIPLELVNDGTDTFRGELVVDGSDRLTYVVQAVDNRGNVTWLDYITAHLATS